MRKLRIRMLLIICMPLLVSGLVSTYLIVSVTSSQLNNQSKQFGQAISDHLAISVADHLFNNDVLSLNVLLAKLIENNNFDSASVYNSNNELLAQAGRQSNSTQSFTQQITFQNVITGYVQIGFNQAVIKNQIDSILWVSLTVHFLLVSVLAFTGWFYGDLIYLWVVQKRPIQKDVSRSGNTTVAAPQQEEAPRPDSTTILVIKIRPTRLLPNYLAQLNQALDLYAGTYELTDGDDILVYFEQTDQLFQAICSGLLILEIFRLKESTITVKVGMHQVLDRKDKPTFEQAKKQASYLASLSDDQMLASRAVQELIKPLAQYHSQPFYSSMAPDGEVYCIDRLNNHSLIESQAKTLAG